MEGVIEVNDQLCLEHLGNTNVEASFSEPNIIPSTSKGMITFQIAHLAFETGEGLDFLVPLAKMFNFMGY